MAPEAAPREHEWISDEGVAILRRVQQRIKEEPKRMSMNTWAMQADAAESYGLEVPSCGTVGCIAGWTMLDGIPPDTLRIMSEDQFNEYISPWGMIAAARQKLGIDYDAARRLFYVENWPLAYLQRYAQSAETARGRATAVRDRIDGFIATGE